MKSANADAMADFILKSSYAWSRGHVNFEDFIQYDRGELAEKQYKSNILNEKSEPSGIEDNNDGIRNENKQEPIPQQQTSSAVYLSSAFLGTISTVLALLFDTANDRGNYLI